MTVCQGAQPTNVGFVRLGGRVTTVNHDSDDHALRARGASFFTLPLIKTQQVSEQKLTRNGLVELFDAAGYYWMNAHLFVDEHPYYARTDDDGGFVLSQVPDGVYEIISWTEPKVAADTDAAAKCKLVPYEQVPTVDS